MKPETTINVFLPSFRGLLTLSGLIALTACGNLQWPPGSSGPGLSNPPRTAAPRVSTTSRRAAPVVAPVQTARIAQPLPIPASGGVTVRPGDSLFLIAQRYGLSVRAVIDANRMLPPYQLIAGQRLRLPQGRRHRVENGDTLYSLSRRYGVNLHEFARTNRIPPPYGIRTGQLLEIPYEPVQVARVQPGVTEPVSRQPSVGRPSRKPDEVESRPPQRSTSRPSAPPPRAKSRPNSGRGVLWPVRGRVISGFGPKGKGLYNDGINILAKRGTPVRAADKGVVAYSGNELRGFGNLLLIKHSNGWITAYAHNETLLVRRGDTVGRGQIIARVGATGNVSVPQLHFEIRDGKNAIDPRRHLQPLNAGTGRRRS